MYLDMKDILMEVLKMGKRKNEVVSFVVSAFGWKCIFFVAI